MRLFVLNEVRFGDERFRTLGALVRPWAVLVGFLVRLGRIFRGEVFAAFAALVRPVTRVFVHVLLEGSSRPKREFTNKLHEILIR